MPILPRSERDGANSAARDERAHRSRIYIQLKHIKVILKAFDFIIVGAGSAGCVLAERLSASGRFEVLVIEAGPDDGSFLIEMPKGIGKLLADPKHAWFYPTEPELGNGGSGETWVRGKTLGGSSSINGMMYNRGQPEDYDDLERSGCRGWNWRSILPHFLAIENHALGMNDWRGALGPLYVSLPAMDHPLQQAMIDSGVNSGLKHVEDMNAPSAGDTIGYFPRTIHRGRRWSAASAFLKPATKRRNVTVLTGTTVERLILDNGRVVGVVCSGLHAGSIRAGREVIVSAGALASPQLLLLSGIGPKAQLSALGIAVAHDLPVGTRLIEHRVLSTQYRLVRQISDNRHYRGARLVWSYLKYRLTRQGVMSAGAYEVGAFVRTREDLPRPDAQLLFAPYSFDLSSKTLAMDSRPGMSCLAFVLRPQSIGSLGLRSNRPADPPLIRPNYMTASEDRATAVRVIRFVRDFVKRPPLSGLLTEETLPGRHVQSDADILDAWNRMGASGYHTVATCRMGHPSERTTVVDERLRVVGVPGLRVVDCSIFPFMIAGNTNAPVMAMAARAADLILADSNT
jgi:choline dehydrogenase